MFDNSYSNTKRDLKENPDLSIKTPGNNLNSWEFAFQRLYEEIKVRHYSPKTFKVYSHWVAKFQTFTHSKPIESLEDSDIKAFLTWLVVEHHVSASTQNQAFNSLLFFFRHIPGIDSISAAMLLAEIGTSFQRAKSHLKNSTKEFDGSCCLLSEKLILGV